MMKLISAIGLMTILSSCLYDSRDLKSGLPCDIADVKYSTSVKPILTANCIECHSSTNASDNLNFESYSGLIPVVNDGRFLGAIKHLPGFVPMPEFAPKLADCDIQKIEKWISNGAPNN